MTSERCELCAEGTYSSAIGGLCQTCPIFTYSNAERTACLLYDQITDRHGTLWRPFNLSPDQFCKEKNNLLACNKDQSLVGPMRHQLRTGVQTQEVIFFFSNHQALKTDRYEFHKSKTAPEAQTDHSYVYMLLNLRNAYLSDLQEFLEDDLFEQEKQHLQ